MKIWLSLAMVYGSMLGLGLDLGLGLRLGVEEGEGE